MKLLVKLFTKTVTINLSAQDLLMILGITGAGCILAYVIVRILLNRTGFKEKEKKIVMYQQ